MSVDGYTAAKFQTPRLFRPQDSVAAVDLKGAAASVLGTWMVPQPPAAYTDGTLPVGTLELRSFGFNAAAAGGAQTTPGTLQLAVNGAAILSGPPDPITGLPAGAAFQCASAVSHARGAAVSCSLNQTLAASKLTTPPSYPTVNPGDIITWIVGTQGVGAGDQTIWPWLSLHEKSGTLS